MENIAVVEKFVRMIVESCGLNVEMLSSKNFSKTCSLILSGIRDIWQSCLILADYKSSSILSPEDLNFVLSSINLRKPFLKLRYISDKRVDPDYESSDDTESECEDEVDNESKYDSCSDEERISDDESDSDEAENTILRDISTSYYWLSSNDDNDFVNENGDEKQSASPLFDSFLSCLHSLVCDKKIEYQLSYDFLNSFFMFVVDHIVLSFQNDSSSIFVLLGFPYFGIVCKPQEAPAFLDSQSEQDQHLELVATLQNLVGVMKSKSQIADNESEINKWRNELSEAKEEIQKLKEQRNLIFNAIFDLYSLSVASAGNCISSSVSQEVIENRTPDLNTGHSIMRKRSRLETPVSQSLPLSTPLTRPLQWSSSLSDITCQSSESECGSGLQDTSSESSCSNYLNYSNDALEYLISSLKNSRSSNSKQFSVSSSNSLSEMELDSKKRKRSIVSDSSSSL